MNTCIINTLNNKREPKRHGSFENFETFNIFYTRFQIIQGYAIASKNISTQMERAQ